MPAACALKIMIVDDDRTMVDLLSTLLDLDGFCVCRAGRLEEIKPLLDRENPDLLLMDVHLHGKDTLAVLAEVRAKRKYQHLPIIMASGLALEETCLKAGADRFLMKPFAPEDLERIIDLYLGESARNK